MNPLLPLEECEVFADGLDHAEGIAYTLDGRLYVGGEAGQLYLIEDDRPRELLSTGGFLLGLAADAAGRIYACDAGHSCVWRITPGTGEREVFADGTPERRTKVPNWGAFDADGNYYFSDSGAWKAREGVLWVVRPGGRAELWTDEPRDFPNGLAVAPDGSRLFLLESTPGALVEIPIRADGSAGPRSVLCELAAVPDGVAVASDGSLVISCYRPDVIYLWREDGELQLLARDPEGTTLAAPTNVAFTGPDLDLMVVPNLGRWHLTRFRYGGLRGAGLFYPTPEQLGG